jgi:polar amino acid transport system substrate-binding protein
MRVFKSLSVVVAFVGALVAAYPSAMAQGVKDRVLKESKITVGIYNQVPWGFKDEKGETRGFDVDLIRAALTGMGVKDIEFVITQFPALIPGLQAGRFDIATGGLYITPQRCKLVSFTETTLKVPDAAIVRAGNPKGIRSFADIALKTDVNFGATRGSLTAQHADMAGVPKDRQVLFQDNASTMSALLVGRVDVMVSTSGAAVALLSDPKVKGLERVMPFQGVLDKGEEVFGNVGLAFRQDDNALRDLFDAQIARFKKDGTLKAIMTRYGFSDAETAATIPRDQLCK